MAESVCRFAVIALLLVLIATTVSARRRKEDVEWRQLNDEATEGLARFDSTDYAFPVHENLVYCRKNVVRIPHDPKTLDYGPVIQEAFNQLSKKGGGTVKLDAGLYWQQTQFEIPSYCCLQGAGMYKTTLKVHEDAPEWPKAAAIRTRFTVRVSVLDITQDGNRAAFPGDGKNRFGIYTHLANYVWMKNMRIVNNRWYGFDPHGANTDWSYYLVMENCYSSGNGKDGFTIDQYYYVSLLNSVAVNNDRHGINVVSGSRYVLIKGNRVRGANACGLTVQNNEFGTRSTRFMENILEDYKLAGICIRGVHDVQAVRNRMFSPVSKAAMFQLQNTWNVTLANNEWLPNPKKFVGSGDNRYEEYATKLIPNTASERQSFMAQFARINDPPKSTVDLSNTSYGTEKADNTVPGPPRRLTLKKGLIERREPKRLVLRKRTHDQFNDPKSNNPKDSDAKCLRGIRVGITCCPKKCGKCVPENCASMGPECCPDSIRIDASSCDTFGPPCVLSRKYTAAGRLYGPKRGETKSPVEQKPDQKPAEQKPEPTPQAKPSEKPAEKPTEHPVEKPTEKPAEKPAHKGEKKEEEDDDDDDHKKTEKKKIMELKKMDMGEKPTMMDNADPECKYGVRNSKTCCPKSCGTCGGKGCGKRGPNKMCCQSGIRRTGRMCKTHGAPCIIRL